MAPMRSRGACVSAFLFCTERMWRDGDYVLIGDAEFGAKRMNVVEDGENALSVDVSSRIDSPWI